MSLKSKLKTIFEFSFFKLCHLPRLTHIFCSRLHYHHFFGMMCSNSQLTGAHPFFSLFIFFCHRHHMECYIFLDSRIFSLSLPLSAWFSSTPFLSFVFYLFFCWIYAGVLVWCLGIRCHKWLLEFIYHHILYQLLRSCLPGLGLDQEGVL